MMERERYPLMLLAAFSRALAHKIRTPLAVISNELSFLATESPESATTATARAKEIAEILKSACCITSAKLISEPVTLTSILEELPQELCSTAVRGDPALLRVAFDALRSVLARYGDEVPSIVAKLHSASAAEAHLVVSAAWSADIAPHERFRSLSELVSERLSLDSLEAPLFDAVMLAHGVEIEISFEESRLLLELKMPVAQ